MGKIADLVKGRRATISALTLAVVVAVPVAVAVTHQGFPVSTAELDARTVWVSNQSQALAGRLSKPIKELTGSTQPKSAEFDIFQDGEAVFVHNAEAATVSKIDPVFNVLEGETQVAVGAVASYARGVIALTRPSDGALWIMFASQPLNGTAEPAKVLGQDAQAVVTTLGTVLAYSPNQGKLFTIPSSGGQIGERGIPDPGVPFELTAVGEQAVILLTGSRSLIMPSGSNFELPAEGLRIQQPGPESDSVLVATGDELLEVPLAGGEPEVFSPGVEEPATEYGDVAAPARLDDCIYGAWASGAREVHQCGEGEIFSNEIRQPNPGDELLFRVNRSVIVLNNIANGDSWLIEDEPVLVANWADVLPDAVEELENGNEEASQESFEDEIANRTDENQYPTARDDRAGARPERATVIPVLDNDTDPDGDVLTITVAEVPESLGIFELVDGGRALQFTAAPGVVGVVSGRYSVEDGRGGSSSAGIAIDVVPDEINDAPTQQRVTSVSLEYGQTMTYNVLSDWRDPDGDEIFLKSATSASGDTVRRTPDGVVNFTHTTAELGQKTIDVVVSDGRTETAGTMIFTVKETGSLVPVGTPDFATAFVNELVSVRPLENDRSPSGEPLILAAVETFDPDIGQPTLTSSGEFVFSAAQAGDYYLKYTIGAGAQSGTGLVRVQVIEDPGNPLPPIAVRDVAYLRPSQSVDLGVLQNDVSPSGRVIGIQSVTVPIENNNVTVEILKNTLLRVSADDAIGEGGAFDFTYTISDGVNEATATVVVVPVPPLATTQPPIAQDDSITVRAGDVVSVSVLDNDFHPDGTAMHIAPDFVAPLSAEQGFAFVAGDQVRYQAPADSGAYTLAYTVIDDEGQLASANVVFTVTAVDEEANRAPNPAGIEARVFAGSALRIDIPIDGIDADGDSVTLINTASSPKNGRVIEQGADWLRYEAFADSPGTDEFSYQLRDAFGATGEGLIRIAVLPPPTNALPPSAVTDSVSLRPNRTGTVAVLANDSDPSGFALALGEDITVDEGIAARVEDSQVVVETEDEGQFTITYSVSNGHGGTDTGYLYVTVDENAPLLPPIAIDHTVESKDVDGESTVVVDARDGAQNPTGLVAELKVGLEGPGTDFAQVGEDGSVSVALGNTRRVVAYTVTSADGLMATAFIFVPRKVSPDWAPPPELLPDLPEQTVQSGELRTWKIADLLRVPSGRTPILVGDDTVTASKSDGSASYVDKDTISFRSEEGYAGPASLNFLVTDGRTAGDPGGNQGFVTLPITVIGQESSVSPVFATRTLEVVVLESATLDLRAATDHPSSSVIAGLRYDELTGATSDITASISGSLLNISAASGTTGKSTALNFRISGSGVEPIVASVNVVIVKSDAPLAQPQPDVVLTQRSRTETMSPLVNDSNPFGASKPLKIVDAVQEQNGTPNGAVSFTESTVRFVPPPGEVGTFSVLYTVMDDTGDASRNRTSRITFEYRDVPNSNPATSGQTVAGDSQVRVILTDAPASNNAAITQYTINASNGQRIVCPNGGVLPCDVTFTGLTNGASYSFSAFATNIMGDGATWSPLPNPVTPWGFPAPPPSASIATSYGSIDMYWLINSGDPAGVTYNTWEMISGSSESANVSPGTTEAHVYRRTPPPGPASTYQFRVRACNPVNCSAWTTSNAVPQPVTPTYSMYRAEPALDGTANRIEVKFSDYLPLGTYTLCGSSSANMLWWTWNTGGGRSPAVKSDCATMTITADRTVQPFGWVLPNSLQAYVELAITPVMPTTAMTVG